jgi:Zn-dependent membrane protease YugP
MTGKEIAEKMLLDHGIRNVKVISTKGKLTDHYDPLKKNCKLK